MYLLVSNLEGSPGDAKIFQISNKNEGEGRRELGENLK
jgi:hypothetical protein